MSAPFYEQLHGLGISQRGDRAPRYVLQNAAKLIWGDHVIDGFCVNISRTGFLFRAPTLSKIQIPMGDKVTIEIFGPCHYFDGNFRSPGITKRAANPESVGIKFVAL